MNIHNTADLISVMPQGMPINVTIVFIDSIKLKSDIIASVTDVCNLAGLSFLNGSGDKAKTLKSCDLKDKSADLAYIELVCYLDGTVIDQCVTQAPVDYQFCLKLLQSAYNKSSGSIVPLSSPMSTRKIIIRKSQSQSSPQKTLIF